MLQRSCDGRQKRASLARVPAKEWARPVAVLAVLRLETLETAKDVRRADLVAPREEAARVVHALRHGQLDVGGTGDAEMHGVDRFVDEHGENAVDDGRAEITIFAR